MVRAVRLGFYWLHKHGCFMRLSGDGPFKCELRPCGLIANSDKCTTFRQYWPSHSGDPWLDIEQIEVLRNITRVKLPFEFWFDDNGRRI